MDGQIKGQMNIEDFKAIIDRYGTRGAEVDE